MSSCEGGCRNCANRTCLAEMNAAYLIEKAVCLVEERFEVSLCYENLNSNEAVVERLTAMDCEAESPNYYTKAHPEQPGAPRRDEHDTIEEYGQAQSEFGQDLNDYMEECEEVRTRSETGEIILYFRTESKDIAPCYVPRITCTTNDTKQEQMLSPVEKLRKQDKRNKEIAPEKTVEDTKKQILEVDMSDCKFGQDEDKMIYFFSLSPLRKEHFEAVGIKEKKPYSYLTDEEEINIIANLTSRQKVIIRRNSLIANLRNAYGNNATTPLLLDLIQKHMSDLLADIKNRHNEVYEKRHQRIEEKKAVLLVQEQVKQETEQSDKQQSEVGMQTEEQPQEENIVT